MNGSICPTAKVAPSRGPKGPGAAQGQLNGMRPRKLLQQDMLKMWPAVIDLLLLFEHMLC
jgi:hypothetical protein